MSAGVHRSHTHTMHRQSMQLHAPFVTLLLAMSSCSGKSTKLESCYVVPSHLLYSRPNCHSNHARPESSCLENPNQIETQCCNAPFNSHSYCTRAPNNQHRFHYQHHRPASQHPRYLHPVVLTAPPALLSTDTIHLY